MSSLESRVTDLIVEQLRRRVRSVRECRALAFCVSVAHAEYMAEALSARGIPALAVHGGTPDAARRAAPDRLRERDVNVLCTCDLYNEGVDLPFVDALLMLRPTASASLFLQQLGRGLRQHERKETCLVLDFIGQHRSEFRFDATLAALSGVPRGQLRRAVVEGFPFLPSGCVMQLDVVARGRILAALQQAIAGAKQLTAEVRELARGDSAYPLATYLEQTAREVEDVYEVGGWTTLLARAGVLDADDSTRDLSRRLGSLLHVDEPARLRAWPSAASASSALSTAARLAPLKLRATSSLDHERSPAASASRTARSWSGSFAGHFGSEALVGVAALVAPLAPGSACCCAAAAPLGF